MREIFEILGADFPDMQTLKQAGLEIDVVEDGDNFQANAIKKAEEVLRISGFPAALADDYCAVLLDHLARRARGREPPEHLAAQR